MTPPEIEIACCSAVRSINDFVDNDFHVRGPDWVRAWYEMSLSWSNTIPAYVVLPEGAVSRLVKTAEQSIEVFSLASFVVGTRVDCGAPLPALLREFASGYLKGTVQPPPGKPGRPRKNTWGRDWLVFDVVYDLVRSLDLPATQNAERSGKRAYEVTSSEIVEAAVIRSKLQPKLTRPQIEKIWHKPRLREEHHEQAMLYGLWRMDEANGIERS